jgi:hypothetical protein
MTVGSDTYRHTLRLWRTLFDMPRTVAQQRQFEALGRLLDKAEATHGCRIRDVVNDYSDAMAIGDLSGRELI